MRRNRGYSLLVAALVAGLALGGCGKKEEKKGPPPGTMVTVTQAAVRDVPVVESSVGEADSSTAPKVGAEVAGRVMKVHVEVGDRVKKGQVLAELDATDFSADARRTEAQAITQRKLAERYQELAKKGFISPAKLEEIEAQNVAAREQYARAAKNLSRTRIVSPVDGRVDARFVSVGDWIDLGKPTFQLSSSESLRVRLPFPETVAGRIKEGQDVTLTTPAAPGEIFSGKVTQIRSLVGTGNRSFDAIVEVKNPGAWRPGGSVDGSVLVDLHPGAVTVPEASVVLRPAGTVVYVVEGGKALQRLVKTGTKREGYVEILAGVKPGETVVMDGAGFLTDQAPVNVKQPGDAAKKPDAAKPAESKQ